MTTRKKILITGPLPPPAGGISIHIWRLQQMIKDEYDIDFIDESSIKKDGIYNLRSFNPFIYLKKIADADLVYVQSGSTFLRLMQLFVAKLFFKKIILTIHAYPFQKKGIAFLLDNSIFNFAKKIIVVNESILTRLKLPAKKCVLKNAFLPPVMETEPSLPADVTEIIANAKRENKIVICGNASRLDIYNNEDLYGVDMCIETSKHLKQKGIDHIFLFIVSSLDDGKDKFEKYINDVKMLGLEGTFLLMNKLLPFVRLIQEADIIVRPTNTDGDAITIRETLYLNKPILASDAVARPQGTLLFKNRDIKDLEEKLENIIMNKAPQDAIVKVDNISDKEFYLNLINEVIKN
ncbi:MAG: hypothetical protein ABI091_07745 [Ferruginibacter sp.]